MTRPASHALLSLLTDAAGSLQAAHDLARAAGDDRTAALIRDAAVSAGSAISAAVRPREHVSTATAD